MMKYHHYDKIVFLFLVIFQSFNAFQFDAQKVSFVKLPDRIRNRGKSFYGYTVKYRNETSRDRLIVGAPYLPRYVLRRTNLQKPPSGDFFDCSKGIDAKNLSFQCNQMFVPHSMMKDSFGQDIEIFPNGSLITCDSNHINKCSGLSYSSGICYKSWTKNSKRLFWSLKWKPECPSKKLDIILLLDGSGSVGSDFKKVKDWTKALAKRLLQSRESDVQLGLIQYSFYQNHTSLENQQYMRVEVPIGNYTSLGDFKKKVQNMSLIGSKTYTAVALNYSYLEFTRSKRFNDTETTKVLILLTDGKSTDHENLNSSAQFVRSKDVKIFAIGVGDAKEEELRMIANGEGTNQRVTIVKTFRDLSRISRDLQREVMGLVLEGNMNQTTTNRQLESGEVGFSTHLVDKVSDKNL